MTEYSRDKRSPIAKDESVSKVMSSNRRQDTGPERILRNALKDTGFRGYRLQWKVPGRPDICFPGRKIAIFVNGCFWHRCPKCDLPLPRTNMLFWEEKFKKNIERDHRNVTLLIEDGWIVHIVWECEIKEELDKVLERIIPSLK